MAVDLILSDGVKRLVYDGRNATMYYANGAVDYFYDVSQADIVTINTAVIPLQAVKNTIANGKHRGSSGGHG
jgi:hypothetical protein